MLFYNDIYDDLQTGNNHDDLITLIIWENLWNGAVKKNVKYVDLRPSPSSFFFPDVMFGSLLFDQGRLCYANIY